MVTSQTTMSIAEFVTGILLISAKQKIVKQYFLLKQLYEIGPRAPTSCTFKFSNSLVPDIIQIDHA